MFRLIRVFGEDSFESYSGLYVSESSYFVAMSTGQINTIFSVALYDRLDRPKLHDV